MAKTPKPTATQREVLEDIAKHGGSVLKKLYAKRTATMRVLRRNGWINDHNNPGCMYNFITEAGKAAIK